MGNQWVKLVINAEDPARLARWWAEALGYQLTHERPDKVEIRPGPDELPGLTFVPGPRGKTGSNRLHLDLRPDDQDAEVERLVDMGARHAEVDGGVEPGGVVLADPEGNEFCVLGGRPIGRQTGRQTGRPIGPPTGRQTGSPIGRQTGRQTGSPTGRQTGRQVGLGGPPTPPPHPRPDGSGR